MAAISDVLSVFSFLNDHHTFSGRQVKNAIRDAIDFQTSTTLDLSSRKISLAGIHELAKAIPSLQTFETLKLFDSGIGDESATILAHALQNNNTFTCIDLTVNSIGVAGSEAIAALLKTNTVIASLNLAANELPSMGAQIVAAALIENNTLTDLNLSYNKLEEACFLTIRDMLDLNTSLQRLSIIKTGISTEGVHELTIALRDNSSLLALELNQNPLMIDAFSDLSKMLCTNTTLTELNLSGCLDHPLNLFQTEGICNLLIGGLQDNSTLQTLCLSGNYIFGEGLYTLTRSLGSITTLNLANNQIQDKDVAKIAPILSNNSTLTSLCLRSNSIHDQSIDALISLLKAEHLVSLDLSINHFTLAGAQAILSSIADNPVIKQLDIRANHNISTTDGATVQNQIGTYIHNTENKTVTLFQLIFTEALRNQLLDDDPC